MGRTLPFFNLYLTIEWQAGWAAERVWGFGEEKYFLPLPGVEPWTVQPVTYSLYRVLYRGSLLLFSGLYLI